MLCTISCSLFLRLKGGFSASAQVLSTSNVGGMFAFFALLVESKTSATQSWWSFYNLSGCSPLLHSRWKDSNLVRGSFPFLNGKISFLEEDFLFSPSLWMFYNLNSFLLISFNFIGPTPILTQSFSTISAEGIQFWQRITFLSLSEYDSILDENYLLLSL